jgi:predicted transcriptional regulator
MTVEISDQVKKQIFQMISTPGTEIEDIVKAVNLDYDTIMKVLSDEYLRSNLDQGRRLCCRF